MPKRRIVLPRETPTSADHVLDVLLAFREAVEPVGVAEISRRVELPTSTVHRALVTLHESGYLKRAVMGTGYQIGLKVHELVYAVFTRFAIHDASIPYLRRLAASSGETAILHVPVGYHAIRIAGIEGWREVHRPLLLGETFPLHAGAAQRAILACLPDAEIEVYFARGPLEKPAPLTVVDRDQLWEDIRNTRARGYTLSFGDLYPEARAVMVPVRDADGRPVASLGVAGAMSQLDPQPGDRCIEEWKTIINELEREVQDDSERFCNPYAHVDPTSIVTAITSIDPKMDEP